MVLSVYFFVYLVIDVFERFFIEMLFCAGACVGQIAGGCVYTSVFNDLLYKFSNVTEIIEKFIFVAERYEPVHCLSLPRN